MESDLTQCYINRVPNNSMHIPPSNAANKNVFINIAFMNIQGLLSTINDLNIWLNQNNIDVLLIAEHFLKSDQLIMTTVINHKKITSFCRNIYQKGGVAIFAKEKIKIREIHYNHCEEKVF
jgi:hypothetical protein